MKDGLIRNILDKFVNMKKINILLTIILTLFVCSFLGCKVSAMDLLYQQREDVYEICKYNVNDSINALINNLIVDGEIDELNLLLSSVSRKDKIAIKNWRGKYNDVGRLSLNDYFGYRLIVLYGLVFQEIIKVEEYRLEFFMAAVYVEDYEILDLLDFGDNALDTNSCYGETVLTTAVRKNDFNMVKYLLIRGIDKNKREFAACYDEAREGQNGYEIAIELGYKKIADLLK